MLTPAHSDLAYSLTRYYFGTTVASVIKTLFDHDQASLKILKFSLPSIRITELKRSLLILVKYQLVDYVKTVKNYTQQYEYSVVPHRVFAFFRIPQLIQVISFREGLLSRIVLINITQKALLSKSNLLEASLVKARQQIHDLDENLLKEKVCDVVERMISTCHLAQTGSNLCANIERLSRDYRDELIVETISSYYNRDTRIGALSRTILNLTMDNTAEDAAITAPVPLMDLIPRLIPENFVDQIQLERYLAKLVTETNNRFIITCGTHPNKGPMYAVHVGFVLDYLVREHLSSIIAARFGPQCCRVFRVLLSRGPLLLKQIEEFIMLPARDVREYSYMLIKEGFIRNRQVPKTPDNAPGKSVFIMSVDLDQVVYGATDMCCRSINNLLLRYEFELDRNGPLLDRSKAVQELLGANDGETKVAQDDWNQYFSSHELTQLNQINKTLDKILLAKTQVDATLSLLHYWLCIRPNLTVDSSE